MPDEQTGSLCVFCRRHEAAEEWLPFCSERCKLQDLARWADGAYRAPADKTDEQSENLELRTKKDSETI